MPTSTRPPTRPPRRPAHHAVRRRPSSPQRGFGIATLAIAAVAAGALALGAGLPLPLAWVLGVSLVTFLTYGYDKMVAGAGPTRVPEVVLLGLALIGGTPGAMLGMLVFRHKTGSKTGDFRAALIVVIALQVIAAFAWIWITQR